MLCIVLHLFHVRFLSVPYNTHHELERTHNDKRPRADARAEALIVTPPLAVDRLANAHLPVDAVPGTGRPPMRSSVAGSQPCTRTRRDDRSVRWTLVRCARSRACMHALHADAGRRPRAWRYISIDPTTRLDIETARLGLTKFELGH